VVRPAPKRVPQALVQALRPAPGFVPAGAVPCTRAGGPAPALLHHPRQGRRLWTRKRTRTVPVCPLSCPPTPMPVPQAQT